MRINKNLPEGKIGIDILIIFSALILLSSIALAVPNSITLQGKLTSLAGVSQQGNYNFTFSIYDASAGGNLLWQTGNTTITTDANGVYDVILPNVNLSFADQYYLGITVGTDQESSPRINLTSSPYSFRANVSEALNPNASYFVNNLSVNGNLAVGNGTSILSISTQLFNFSAATGNLNINGTVAAKYFVGDGSQLSGIGGSNPFNSSTTNVYFNETNANLGLGLSNPADRLVVIGNVRISGSLNASSINTTGITLLGTNSGKVGINITNPSQTLQILGTLNITSSNTRSSDLFVAATGFVGIGLNNPNDALEVFGNARISGSLNASFINASRIFVGNTPVQISGDFDLRNISNYTQFSKSADFNLGNISNNTIWRAELDNGSLIRTGNLTALNTLDNYIRVKDFSLNNVSSFTNMPFSNFRLENVSNNTIGRNENVTIALWNVSNLAIYPRDSALIVRIGSLTENITNDTLTVKGSVAVYGSLNSTFINATQIRQGNNLVQTVESAFNLANNGTLFIRGADFSLANVSNYTQYTKSADFNLGNISNQTLVKGDNATDALWNVTANGKRIFPRDAEANISIGLNSSQSAITQLHVAGRLPNLIGSVTVSSAAVVHVQGKYAYVGSDKAAGPAFTIVDISNITSPLVVSSVGAGRFYDLAVQGKYAYVGTYGGNSIIVYDISNPANPVQVGKIALGGNTGNVYVQGRYAYITSNEPVLNIVDISNPNFPTIGTVSVSGNPWDVFVQGRYAYVHGLTTLDIVDISNPSSPVQVSTMAISAGTSGAEIYVQGRYAYLTDYNNNALKIIDVSNVTSPKNVSNTTTGTNPGNVFVQDRYAYVVAYTGNAIQVFDVSNPGTPVNLGSVTTATNPLWVDVQGRYAYVAALGGNKLEIYDLGGAYIQSLEAGSIEAAGLATIGNAKIGNDLSVVGGLTVGSGIATYGPLSVYTGGNDTINGSVFTVGPNGRVGVNTSAPAQTLVVLGTLNITAQSSRGGADLIVNPSGLVGIGTASPTDTLTVVGSLVTYGSLNATFINATTILIGSKPVQASADFNLGNISNQTLVKGDNATLAQWNVSGNNIFNRNFAVNVGIGTTGPQNPLEVIGAVTIAGGLNATSINATQRLIVNNTLFVNGSRVGIRTSTPSSPLEINIGTLATRGLGMSYDGTVTTEGLDLYYNNNANTNVYLDSRYDNAAADMRFRLRTAGTAVTAMTLVGSGNVGIGTTSPNNILDVRGTINASGLLLTNNTFSITQIGNVGIGTNSPQYLLQVASGTTGQDVNLSNVLYVNGSSGNVGIGTSAPVQKLSINGGNFLQTINGTPTNLGGIDIGQIVRSIYVANGYAYIGLSDNSGNDFMILDVSNFTNSSKVITVNNVSGIDFGGNVNSVFVAGKYAYLATSVSNNFDIVDINNVTAPKNVSSLSLQSGQAANSIYVSGKYAYVGAATIFTIIDISNPQNPSVLSSTLGVSGGISSIYVVGKYAYVGATSGATDFSIIDISNPINPVMVGSLGTGAGVNGVAVSGKYAYISTTNNALNDFYVIDVSNPNSPKNISGINLPGGIGGTSVSVIGKYAYLGTDWGNMPLEIIDVSDSLNPVAVGSITSGFGGTTKSSFINGKYAYVGTTAGTGNEFVVLDISGIDAPAASIGSLSANTLAVKDNAQIGNDLYVGSGLVVGGGAQINGPLGVFGGSNQSINSSFFTVNQNGKVGIGTNVPSKALTINGTTNAVTIEPSANPNPVMNTTGNNLTISSASGSVIIRLG